MSRDDDVLIVFARFPAAGRVKTRLAAALGAEAAARLYDAFVRDLVHRFKAAPFRVQWAIAPPDPGFAGRYGIPPEACVPQRGDHLGSRMRNALSEVLARGGSRCVLIGSDAPHLPLGRIEEAFARLSGADLVLGPARDGGYYLVAQRQAHDVFAAIPWSTGEVLSATRRRALSLGLKVELLELDFDVDEEDDLRLLSRALSEDPRACPSTRRVLAELARA